MKMLGPIIPHTLEEVYSNINSNNKQESFLLDNSIYKFDDLNFLVLNFNTDMDKFFKVKDIIFKEIENMREQAILSKNIEVDVEIGLENETYNSLKDLD
jgi:isoleucyl-tRNA synthetase